MRTNEFKMNQLNFEPPNKTVKLSAVAATALHTNIDVSEILDKATESFKGFGEGQHTTYIVAKVLGVPDSRIGKVMLPEILRYLGIKPANDKNYDNIVPLGELA